MIVKLTSKINLFQFLDSSNLLPKSKYLLKKKPENKKDKIIGLAYEIQTNITKNIGIEIKYKLGYREKRIEIVFILNNKLYISKITSKNKIDYEVFKLDEIISHVKQDQIDKKVIGIIFYEGYLTEEIINYINKIVNNEIT